MTLQREPLYGIAYADADTALDELPAVTRSVADSLAAAMGRAGYTPPDATSFAQLAATVNSNGTRLSAVEGKLTDTGWVNLGINAAKFTVTPGGVLRYRVRNGTCRLQAFLQGVWAAGDYIAQPLPVAARPPAAAGNPQTLYRLGVRFDNTAMPFTVRANDGNIAVATAAPGPSSGFIFETTWDVS